MAEDEVVKTGQLHIIFDGSDNPWGPFENGQAAVEWAKRKWPKAGEGDDWELWALRAPD